MSLGVPGKLVFQTWECLAVNNSKYTKTSSQSRDVPLSEQELEEVAVRCVKSWKTMYLQQVHKRSKKIDRCAPQFSCTRVRRLRRLNYGIQKTRANGHSQMRQEARIQFKNISKMLKRLQTCRNNLWNRQELSRLWNWNRINVCSLPGSRDVGWDDDDGTGPGDRKHNLLEARVIHLVLSRHHCAKDSHLTKSICQCKNLKSLWTSNSSSLLQVVLIRTHTNNH